MGTETTCSGLELTSDQQEFKSRFLDWIQDEDPLRQTACLQGMAGSGKTTTLWYTISEAYKSRLLTSDTQVMAFTHSAVKRCEEAYDRFQMAMQGTPFLLPPGRVSFSTIHRGFLLIPSTESWSSKDQKVYEELLSLEGVHRSQDDQRELLRLGFKRSAALSKELVFKLHPEKRPDFGYCGLLVVDECSMVSSDVMSVIEHLKKEDFLSNSTKILYMGDSEQLPPINERLSQTFMHPRLGDLNQVMRNKGLLSEYWLKIRGSSNLGELRTLHLPYTQKFQLELLELDFRTALFGAIDQLKAGHDVVFIAARNEKVQRINKIVRQQLYDCLDHRPGDILLTRAPVRRGGTQAAGPTGNAKKGLPLVNTSTLVRLEEPCAYGERLADMLFDVPFSDPIVTYTPEHDHFTSPFGTRYRRTFWRYSIVDSGSPVLEGQCLTLLDPSQTELFVEECTTLHKMALSTISSGSKKKTSRGQNGEFAQQVWAQYGLKNWFKHSDGTSVDHQEYRTLTGKLWRDYYSLANRVDKIWYSYCRTVHAMQGSEAECVIIDAQTVFPGNKKVYASDDGTWDSKKLTYTAVTRATKQLVIAI